MNRTTRIVVALAALALVSAGSVTALYLQSSNQAPSTRPLPPGCVAPAGGFLIVASSKGYNDSIAHGAPTTAWPVVHVTQGQNVTITVCNTDTFPHGFQVSHYFSSGVETVQPGQILHVSFMATDAGTFAIYCEIFCAIHPYMQSGQLVVST